MGRPSEPSWDQGPYPCKNVGPEPVISALPTQSETGRAGSNLCFKKLLPLPLGDSHGCLNSKSVCLNSINLNNNEADIPGSEDVLLGEIDSRNNLHSENTGLSLWERGKNRLKNWLLIHHFHKVNTQSQWFLSSLAVGSGTKQCASLP